MKSISLRIGAVLLLVCVGLIATTTVALADPPAPATGSPFLCPVVGHGVTNAELHNGPGRGVDPIYPPVGTSFIPGHNQAGLHANENALNKYGPGKSDAGPGHNPDFSPLWPHHGGEFPPGS